MHDDQIVRRADLPLRSRFVAARTPTETRLAEIWASAFGMDRVGVEDSYNDLGGDSFIATIIFGMIEDDFGEDIPLSLLSEAATIAALAKKIDAASGGA